MKSNAATVDEYLASLPADRREAIAAVRAFMRDELVKGGFEERMQYGVVGYCVPHAIWPHGHHTNPKLPLMYAGLSSQKNDMVIYMLMLQHHTPMRAWFERAWKASGGALKLKLDVSGMGCCLRFRRVEDLPLTPDGVIAETFRRLPMKAYLEHHTTVLASIGQGPAAKTVKKTVKKTAKKTAKKKVAAATKTAGRGGRGLPK